MIVVNCQDRVRKAWEAPRDRASSTEVVQA